jgi:hypothetical protein
LTITSAVRSSIARSYSSTGIVSPSGLRSHRISAPVFRAQASQTCPSVGKSSSDRITVRRSSDRSRHDAIVESAIEMFVVRATSSASQPASAENERFREAILGKMSSNQTGSGAPFDAHASRYSSR